MLSKALMSRPCSVGSPTPMPKREPAETCCCWAKAGVESATAASAAAARSEIFMVESSLEDGRSIRRGSTLPNRRCPASAGHRRLGRVLPRRMDRPSSREDSTMKISLRAAAALAAVALSTPAFAQQQQVSAGSRFGIGVGLPTEQGLLINAFDNIGFGPAAAPALYFPINVTPSFRLEPQIGRVSVSRDA